MDDYENLERFAGLWCVFPSTSLAHTGYMGFETMYSDDAVKIFRIEEIGVRFGGIPYIRFQADHDHTRVIELLGGWTIAYEKRVHNKSQIP